MSRIVPHDSRSSRIPLREIMGPSGAAFRSTLQKPGHSVPHYDVHFRPGRHRHQLPAAAVNNDGRAR